MESVNVPDGSSYLFPRLQAMATSQQQPCGNSSLVAQFNSRAFRQHAQQQPSVSVAIGQQAWQQPSMPTAIGQQSMQQPSVSGTTRYQVQQQSYRPAPLSRTIWSGIIEFVPFGSHPLKCTFNVQAWLTVNALRWPNRLFMQCVSGPVPDMSTITTTMLPIAHPIHIQSSQESEAALSNKLGPGRVGIIQFPESCDTRIMIVFGCICMAFLPFDQKFFYNGIKEKGFSNFIQSLLKSPVENIYKQQVPPLVNSSQWIQGPSHQSSIPRARNINNYVQAKQFLDTLKANRQQHMTSPYTKSKPVSSCARLCMSSSKGTHTVSPIVHSLQELESQASKIFHKDLVQKVTQKVFSETGKRPTTLEKLCDEVLMYQGVKLKPSDGSTDNKENEEQLCKICFDQRLNMVFDPCGHMVTCQGCSRSLTDCPICRVRINKKIRVYTS